MTTDSPKKQLMIAKQHLDKLSVFIVNSINFYQGVHPDLDSELNRLRSFLSGKPKYDAATELTAEINNKLKKDAKHLKQRNLEAVNSIESALKTLQNAKYIPIDTKNEVDESLKSLKTSADSLIAPVDAFGKALALYKSALENVSGKASNLDDEELKALHEQITQELKELIAPFYNSNKTDANIREVYQKLTAGIHHQALLECCLVLIRYVIRDLIQEANSTSKLVDGLHQSLSKIGQGIKKTIESSQSRSQKRQAQNKSMQAQISAMESVVSDSAELDSLKLEAQRYLESMQASISKNQKEEVDEQAKLHALLSKMHERIAELETQAHQHQQKLFKQRANALADQLTKLPNRMAYEEKLVRELRVMEEHSSALCIAILDVDHFKNINDKYGHSVGDKTLQVIASNIRKHLEKSCFVARWGGEEFVCLLPKQSIQSSFDILEQVRKKIAALPFKFKGERVQVTVSIGIAEYQDSVSAESTFELADKRLYSAKSNGRNQTIIE
jgi:diguanylate cyclase (GGDEF)-like protein